MEHPLSSELLIPLDSINVRLTDTGEAAHLL